MNKYYIEIMKDSNGNNPVHKESCIHMPRPENVVFLGVYSTCAGAVTYAKKRYPNASGCWHCARECYIR